MSTVETVRGPVDAGELGTTLMHEHVFILQPEALQNWGHAFGPLYWDEQERLADAVAKLGAVREAGIRTIVDQTVPGLGRYIPRLQTLNAEVDLNIVVATGVYAFIELSKNAQARTGLEALEALTSHGVKPERIVIAHAGDSNDLAYLRAIADKGAWLGCDRFGIEHFNPLPDRISTLLALLGEGYGKQIHLSHDAACFYDFFVGDPAFADEKPDYLLISNQVLPALREQGVNQAQIDEMMVDNPRRFLTGIDAAPRPEAAAGAAAVEIAR